MPPQCSPVSDDDYAACSGSRLAGWQIGRLGEMWQLAFADYKLLCPRPAQQERHVAEKKEPLEREQPAVIGPALFHAKFLGLAASFA